MADVRDVAIVGGGPAGLALAAACERRGLTTVVIGDEMAWTQTLGTWVDDLSIADDAEQLVACLRVRWPVVTVKGTVERALHRDYAVFDNVALARRLAPRDRIEAIVTGVTRSGDHHVLACGDGRSVDARLVFDCGGARSSLLSRHRRGSVPVQSAFGVFTDRAGLVDEGSFIMMDWSVSFSGHPTFLYAMDLGDGRALVEETALVGDSDLPAAELQHRLLERLGREAIDGVVETVSIPMGGRLPARSTTVVGFGAAAGYIHPVTGYSVAASLRAAPRVADVVARAIGEGRRGPALVDEAWRAVWPADLLRTRALHDYGLAALRRLESRRIGEFFDAFFALSDADWADYLRIDTPARRVAAIMTRFFLDMPPGVRRRVMGTSPRSLVGVFARGA